MVWCCFAVGFTRLQYCFVDPPHLHRHSLHPLRETTRSQKHGEIQKVIKIPSSLAIFKNIAHFCYLNCLDSGLTSQVKFHSESRCKLANGGLQTIS